MLYNCIVGSGLEEGWCHRLLLQDRYELVLSVCDPHIEPQAWRQV